MEVGCTWRCAATVAFLFYILSPAGCMPQRMIVDGLYSDSDHVTILNNANFYRTILNKGHTWVVQFYNSWCGHCRNFAPFYKQFVNDVKDWEHTVQLAVIDCVDEENTGLCREYEVLGYPTILVLPPNAGKGDLGTQMRAYQNTSLMRHTILNTLTEHQRNGSISAPAKVNLLPYNGSASGLFDSVAGEVHQAAVIVDVDNGTVAREALMDLGYFTNVVVLRWAKKDSAFLKDVTIPSLPAVVLVNRDMGAKQVLTKSVTTRRDVAQLIIKKLKLNEHLLPSVQLGLNDPSKLTTTTASSDDSPVAAGDGDTNKDAARNPAIQHQYPDSAFSLDGGHGQVYMVDIENTVLYTLQREVALHKTLSGDSLKAFRGFLSVLVKYLPARPQFHSFLTDFQSQLSTQDVVSYEVYDKVLTEVERKHGGLTLQPWIGCLGSKSNLRRYPCGLWTTFHTLTVNAVLIAGSERGYDAKEVLRAVHAYVKTFFSCSHCSRHFQDMYAVDAESYVNSPDDAILWLWRAHNKVNKRLKGDATEDPQYPKVQYPPRSHCSSCWSGDNFDERAVLAYLKRVYGKESLSLKGVQILIGLQGSITGKNLKELTGLAKLPTSHEKVNPRYIDDVQDTSGRTWTFNNVDISMCVILYGVSSVIILAFYGVIVMRRRMKRRRFIDMFKNPANSAEAPTTAA